MELEMYSDPTDRQRFVRGLVAKDLAIAKDLFYRLALELTKADIADVMNWPLIDPKQGLTLEGKICDNE